MKNHELLDMIGDVNEDCVLEAGDNVVQPRFRWKALAACAACAALALGAYPVYRMSQGQGPSGLLPLHDYSMVVEGGGTLDTQGDTKAPANGGEHDGEDDAGQTGLDGVGYDVPDQDVPVQEKAAAQYDNFLNNSGLGGAADWLPEWCGGIWIDNSYEPEAKLTVAIVDGFRTPELEAQIEEWCGGEVVFKDVTYSWSYLDQLMLPISEALKEADTGMACGFGVDVMENCLQVDLYGDAIPDAVLVKLGQLDPAGDAIRVRLFSNQDILTDKGPAPGGDTQPASAPEENSGQEDQQPAVLEDLPASKYDAIAE